MIGKAHLQRQHDVAGASDIEASFAVFFVIDGFFQVIIPVVWRGRHDKLDVLQVRSSSFLSAMWHVLLPDFCPGSGGYQSLPLPAGLGRLA